MVLVLHIFKYGYFHLHSVTNTDFILSKQILACDHYNRTQEHRQLAYDLVYWYRYDQFVYDNL